MPCSVALEDQFLAFRRLREVWRKKWHWPHFGFDFESLFDKSLILKCVADVPSWNNTGDCGVIFRNHIGELLELSFVDSADSLVNSLMSPIQPEEQRRKLFIFVRWISKNIRCFVHTDGRTTMPWNRAHFDTIERFSVVWQYRDVAEPKPADVALRRSDVVDHK